MMGRSPWIRISPIFMSDIDIAWHEHLGNQLAQHGQAHKFLVEAQVQQGMLIIHWN